MMVDGVPLDSVTHKEVVVRALDVIDAVKVTLKALREPPATPVVLSAAVVEATVVVTILGRELVTVVVVPRRRERVASVATVTADVQPVAVALIRHPEVVVLGPEVLTSPVGHLNTQTIVAYVC